MSSFANQIENAFLRDAVHGIVRALERGHGPIITIVISVAILAAVYLVKRAGANKNRPPSEKGLRNGRPSTRS